MSGKRQLSEFNEAKCLLVLEADLHRALLRAECASIGARLSWVRQAGETAWAASPWLAVGAAGIGVLIARRWRSHPRWIPTILAALRVGAKVLVASK
jgi:hypothetical protein